MTHAFEIPGYVQGHRFLDDPLYYDSTAKRFKDLAGYDHLGNGLTITTGNPIFETVGGNRGLRLDNTFNGSFRCPIPWMGTMICVIKPQYLSGLTAGRYPLIFGDAVNPLSNGRQYIYYTSTKRGVQLVSAGAQLQTQNYRNDDNCVVVVMAFDQQTRMSYSTVDGVTIATATAPANTTNGNAVSLSTAGVGVRFGNMTAIEGDVTQVTDLYCQYYEQHFFDGNILLSDLAKTKEFIDKLKAQYNIA